jgi:cytochrome bd-type quinol oxidase subunit 2
MNTVVDHVQEDMRTCALSVQAAISGLISFLGPLCAGVFQGAANAIVKATGITWISGTQVFFVLCGVIMLLGNGLMFAQLRQMKKEQKQKAELA